MKITPDMKNEFWHWINENWNIAGGLITHSIAAAILGKSQTRIRQMVKEGKLREFRFKTKKFLSFSDLMNMTREKAYQDFENATEMLYPQGAKKMLEFIENQKAKPEEQDKKEEPQSSFPGPQAVLPEN